MSAAEAKAQREAKERAITNLRNKDRPSIQIYQPKRRTGNASGTDNTSPNEYKTQISSENETYDKMDNEKPSTSSKCSDSRKRCDKKNDSSKGYIDDSKKSSNEKRISRYSEKRNKVKEKRDLTDNPTATNDCTLNSNNKENTDEMS